ncbi:hypothetical protein CC80DRAFT_552383 [Byssothecium circinans]|uniref:Transcription factor domain-containing protein n=1 Tax=Byssothecium circinans TaxID=147558 RepID=A0A6A5TIW5_9PLEO|nr:hypothetical protein CC80DRAFT_552383 [Byssothecium circinans]
MPSSTFTASTVNTLWTQDILTMDNSPHQAPHSPYFAPSPEEQPTLYQPQQPKRPRRSPSATSSSRTRYQFIMQTGDESSATAKQKLKTVRSHVMKNYLHQQHNKQSKETGEGSIATSSSDRRRSKQRARNNRSGSPETNFFLSSASPPTPNADDALPVMGEIGGTFSEFSLPMPYASDAYASQSDSAQGQRFALDFNFITQADEVSYYSQAYANSVVQDKMAGLLQPSFQTLNAKGETMRVVQDTIAICGNSVPPSIICAVCLLALGCSEDQEWDQARGHLEAMQRLLDIRGGIHTIDFELQRTVTWVAYTLSAALRLSPQYPLPLFSDTRPFTLAFQDDAQIRAWRTVKRFPKDAPFVFDIVVRFHQLGLATSGEWYEEVDQKALSNFFFETMHCAATLQIDEPWNNIPQSGNQAKGSTIMFQIWAVGLPLYVWATARHARRSRTAPHLSCHRYDPVFARIREILEGVEGYHAWPRGKTLEPVLATLFYAVEACQYYSFGWRPWCIGTLRLVVDMLKLKKVEEFKKALEFFPLTDEHRLMADAIWTEMMHGSIPSNTPAITVSTMQ